MNRRLPAAARLAAIDPPVTGRLRLRPPEPADLADLLRVYGDAEVVRHLPHPAWRSRPDAEAWWGRMQELQSNGSGRPFVLARRDSDVAIGAVLLFRHDRATARCEVAYALARAHWGQGLMREAVQALCDGAFAQAGLRRIDAEVRPGNAPSNRLLAALGFVRRGLLLNRWQGADGGLDVVHWEKTRAQGAARSAAAGQRAIRAPAT